MKSIWSALPLAVAPVLLAGTQGAQARPTVAYVNAQRIFSESSEAKTEIARFQTRQQLKSAELRDRQQELEATRQRLASATDDAARIPLQRQLVQQQSDLERARADAQGELQSLQRQVQSDLQARIKPIIAQLAKERNIQLVVGDPGVVWASPESDLTASVLDRLNAQKPKP